MSNAPPLDLRAQILAAAARTPAPLRSEHERRVLLIGGGGLAGTALLFFALGGLAIGDRPRELVVFSSGLTLLAAVVGTRLASGGPRRARSMLGPPRLVLLAASVLVGPVLAAVAIAAAAIWPELAEQEVPTRSHVACGALTLAQGALPLLVLFLPRRASDPVHPAVTGAALGMSAGAWAAMFAYLRCPHASATHCVLAHVIPAVLFMLAGALLGRSVLKMR